MSDNIPTLHLMCGKIASGKSTLAANLGCEKGHVTISEDDWLAELFSDQMRSISDYVRCSNKLQHIMASHVASLLNAGVSVVLDFPANTIAQRKWMRDIINATDAQHQLHFIDVPDKTCIERLHDRNALGEHPFSASEEQFALISKHFVPPTDDEGFNIIYHRD
ncbi:MAG: ATP-binding protein [Lentilitoribacter sp.]